MAARRRKLTVETKNSAYSRLSFCRILTLTDLVMFFRILNLVVTMSSVGSVDKEAAW